MTKCDRGGSQKEYDVFYGRAFITILEDIVDEETKPSVSKPRITNTLRRQNCESQNSKAQHVRSFCVVRGSSRSKWVPAPHSLPQGFVLGPFSTSFTHLNLVLSLLPMLCWVSCTPTISSPTCTVWHLMPWLVTRISSNRLRFDPFKTQLLPIFLTLPFQLLFGTWEPGGHTGSGTRLCSSH